MCKPWYYSNRLSKKQNSFDKGDKIVPHPPVFETLFLNKKAYYTIIVGKRIHFIFHNHSLTLKVHSEKKKKGIKTLGFELGAKTWLDANVVFLRWKAFERLPKLIFYLQDFNSLSNFKTYLFTTNLR